MSVRIERPERNVREIESAVDGLRGVGTEDKAASDNASGCDKPLALDDLRRGMLVRWDWLPTSIMCFKAKDGSDPRPVGRVVTREDLPHMYDKDCPFGIQLLDCEYWVIGPAAMLKKGRPLYAADPAEFDPEPISSAPSSMP